MIRHAVGILVQDRPELTRQTLMSVFLSDQNRNSYDLFVINNGSDKETSTILRSWCGKIKNIFCLNRVALSKAWNLFLAVTQDYEYRTKIDNDIVLAYTPIWKSIPRTKIGPYRGPMVNPGAPVSVGIVKGSVTPKKKQKAINSAFLDHMEENGQLSKAGISALVCADPTLPFKAEHELRLQNRWRDRPYVPGGCVQISKSCFEKIGYFDERLSRLVDLQYSQRAMVNGVSICFHPTYWAFHVGIQLSPDEQRIREQEMQESAKIMDAEELPRDGMTSIWEDIASTIKKESDKHKIVNLTI